MHRWAEHEVPIEIYSDVPGKSDLFQRLVTLMRIFYREEKMVYSAQTEVAASTPDALPSAPKRSTPFPPCSHIYIYLYIYIYMCVCVCMLGM